MKIIGTSKPNAHFFLLLGTPILNCISFLFRTQIKIKLKLLKEYPLIVIFVMFIGEILSIFFAFNQFCRPKPKVVPKAPNRITIVLNTTTRLNDAFPHFLVILTGLIDFFATFTVLMGNSNTNGQYREGEIQIIQIFMTMSICYFYFSCSIYRHQILAIVLILIGSIVLFFSDETFIVWDLWFVFHFFLNSARILNEKWAMEKRYANPFVVLFFEGVAGLIATIIAIVIGTLTKCNEDETKQFYCESFETFKIIFETWLNALYVILSILLYCFLNIGYILILKYYDPNMRVVAMSTANVLNLLSSLLMNKVNWLEMYIIGNCFILLGALIYNEIIILYLCGLGEGTKKEINKRCKTDMREISINLSLENGDNNAIE